MSWYRWGSAAPDRGCDRESSFHAGPQRDSRSFSSARALVALRRIRQPPLGQDRDHEIVLQQQLRFLAVDAAVLILRLQQRIGLFENLLGDVAASTVEKRVGEIRLLKGQETADLPGRRIGHIEKTGGCIVAQGLV